MDNNNIPYNMEPWNFSYVFTRSSERNMTRYLQISVGIFYLIAVIMKFEFAASITMTFCDKNMDMHDIRLIHCCIPFSPDLLLEF